MAAIPSTRRRTWRFARSVFAGFALGQLALGAAIDCLAPLRDPEVEAKLARLRARRAEALARPLVVVLGSSRTAYGLDAATLSRDSGALVFNFGIMGGGPLMHLVNLRRLLDAGVRPDLLYVEVMPPLLADRDPALEEKLLEVARLRLDEVLALCRHSDHRLRLLRHWCLARLLPTGPNRAGLHSRITGDEAFTAPGVLDGHGWRARRGGMDEKGRREGAELIRNQYEGACTIPAVAPGSRHALEALLDLCRREGIAVRLLLMPEGKGFRDLYSAPAWQAICAYLDQLRARWGVGVVDARTWVEDAGFWDTHHLLAEGACCFTARFQRESLQGALAELTYGGQNRGAATASQILQREKRPCRKKWLRPRRVSSVRAALR